MSSNVNPIRLRGSGPTSTKPTIQFSTRSLRPARTQQFSSGVAMQEGERESHSEAVEEFMTNSAQEFCSKPTVVEVVLDAPEKWWDDVVSPRLDRIAEECGVTASSRILDVGTGTGAMIAYLTKDGRAKEENIVGLDLCEPMLEEAAKRFPAATMVQGDIADISIDAFPVPESASEEEGATPAEREFDVIIFNAVFSTLFDQAEALRNAARLLKRGGKIVISHPLGAKFVATLREDDESLLVHALPDAAQLEQLVRFAPLSLASVHDEDELYIASLTFKPVALLESLLCMRGEVATGYGRGGKKLGVPTANLPESQFAAALSDVPTGVYCGWASLPGQTQPYKAVVNVGYSPTFVGEENREKIVEAHLLGDVGQDFYGQEMRLILAGFQRSEKKFASFPMLLAAIKQDIEDARAGLDGASLAQLSQHPFLSQPEGSAEDFATFVAQDCEGALKDCK